MCINSLFKFIRWIIHTLFLTVLKITARLRGFPSGVGVDIRLVKLLKAKPLNRPYLFVRCCWSETSWRRRVLESAGRVSAGARQLTTLLLLRNGGLCRVGKRPRP